MRPDEQILAIEGEYRAVLARMAWRDLPTARLRYHAADDSLIVDLIENDPLDEIVVLERLLVQFDGTDPDALPVAIALTSVRSDPDSPAVTLAREVLGERLWAAVQALIGRGGGQLDAVLDAVLDADEALACRRRWDGLASLLRDPGWVRDMSSDTDWVVGVELVPGRAHLVLTDGAAIVVDEEIVDLDGNEPGDVVVAIAASVDRLAARHPAIPVTACPISIQLGGPVDTRNGIVEYYDKPVLDGDRPWQNVPLAELIHEATGQDALIFNDAWAFAMHEAEFGLGRRLTKVVVLVVRHGVGAKLLHDGRLVDDFPMEIGVFMPGGGAALGEIPSGGSRSIEADAGLKAIIDRVRKTGTPCTTIQDAADAARDSDAVREVFRQAGRGLARGMAAVQALINPDAWVVVGPAAIVDAECPSAVAFLAPLKDAKAHVAWSGLLPGVIVPRSTTGPLGARAAALAALRSGRIKSAFPSEGGAGEDGLRH